MLRIPEEPRIQKQGIMRAQLFEYGAENMENTGSSPKRFCEQCGTQIRPDNDFCVSCGNRVARERGSEQRQEQRQARSFGPLNQEPLFMELRESMRDGARWAQMNLGRISLGCGGLALLFALLGGCAATMAFIGGGFSGGMGGGGSSGGFTSDEQSYISDVRSDAYALDDRTSSEIVDYGRETCHLFDNYGDAYSVEDELYSETPGEYGYYEVNTVMLYGVENFCSEHSGAMYDWYDY